MDKVDVDEIQRHLGNGFFQALAFCLLGFIYSRGAWHVFGILFLSGDPGHKCALPDSKMANLKSDPGLSLFFTGKKFSDGLVTSGPELEINDSRLYTFNGNNLEDVNWTVGMCGLSSTFHNGSNISVTEGCPYGWSYGSVYETTILTEWDLVCEQSFLVELSITIFMVGSTVGAMLILPMADLVGRKQVMLVCLLSQACVGAVAAVVRSYTLFVVLRFIVGMLNIGIGVSSFVLMTEMFPADKRTVMSVAFQAFWPLGVMTVAGFGYLVRNWRHLELLISLPNLLAIPCYWLLPESLPWLISQERKSEALSAVKKMARFNGKDISYFSALDSEENSVTEPLPLHERQASAESENPKMTESENGTKMNHHSLKNSSETNGHLLVNGHKSAVEEREEAVGSSVVNDCLHQLKDRNRSQTVKQTCKRHLRLWILQCTSIINLFQHPKMRLYSFIMFFLSFVNSLGYFGISFSVPTLHGNPFVNLCIMGFVELPANIICIIISQKVGRRYPCAFFLLLCGVCNIVALFTPLHYEVLKLAFVMTGKFAITAAYSTVYLYSAEIFPTAVRNQGMGISSVFENIGSISAPFIVLTAKSITQLPLVVFGSLSIAGACLTLFLPETHNRPLPQTVQDITTL